MTDVTSFFNRCAQLSLLGIRVTVRGSCALASSSMSSEACTASFAGCSSNKCRPQTRPNDMGREGLLAWQNALPAVCQAIKLKRCVTLDEQG